MFIFSANALLPSTCVGAACLATASRRFVQRGPPRAATRGSFAPAASPMTRQCCRRPAARQARQGRAARRVQSAAVTLSATAAASNDNDGAGGGSSSSDSGDVEASCLEATTLSADEVLDDAYVVLGVACCFKMNEDCKLDELLIVEPLPSSALETIALGVETSYKRIMAVRFGDVQQGSLPEQLVDGEAISLCEQFHIRLRAAARTYRGRDEARRTVALGQVSTDLNFSVERKRVLNDNYRPSFDDNVKQHNSIDVYGRGGGGGGGGGDDGADGASKADIDRLYNL